MTINPRIYLDTCCFIDMVKYSIPIGLLGGREPHVFFCRKFLEAARASEATVFTSMLTVAECTSVRDESLPQERQTIISPEVKRLIEGMLLSGKSGVMPVQATPKIVKASRDLLWVHGATFKPMDALHIATALTMKCTHFLTTDSKLKPSNISIANQLGLSICTADAISHLLPSKYSQLPLAPSGGHEANRPAA